MWGRTRMLRLRRGVLIAGAMTVALATAPMCTTSAVAEPLSIGGSALGTGQLDPQGPQGPNGPVSLMNSASPTETRLAAGQLGPVGPQGPSAQPDAPAPTTVTTARAT